MAPGLSERMRLPRDPAERLHRVLLIGMLAVMGLESVGLAVTRQFQSAATVAGIMALIASPLVLRRRLSLRVPYAFQILVVVFVFAALFLGEVREYYDRFPWWDSVLHLGSGLLLGILGFLMIYLLNEDERIDLSVRPAFMALFAFCFALAAGALWEIFEFGMDRLFGANMQKPMLGDESGLTDTMTDLMLDAGGGLAISLYGWAYMRRGEHSFISGWIARFAAENPDWFERMRPRRLGRKTGSGD